MTGEKYLGWNTCNLWILLISTTLFQDICFCAKLERKQDFFEVVDSYNSKPEYGLNEIGKRGFSTLGFDRFSSSSGGEYGRVLGSDYTRSSGGGVTVSTSDVVMSPARDLIPPPPPSSSSSSGLQRSSSHGDYSKYNRISIPSSSSSESDFHGTHRSTISRRSPQSPSISRYFEEIGPSHHSGHGGRIFSSSPNNYGLVTDNDGKLIGYHGSIIPGYHHHHHSDSPPPPIISSEPSSFIGSYFQGSPPIPKFSLSPSVGSSSGGGIHRGHDYSSTPIYYPGREEDHTYRIRDTTSQGYDDEEVIHQPPPSSLEDSDHFSPPLGIATYQPSPLSPPPTAHHHHQYHLRENEGHGHIGGHNHIIEPNHRFFSPYDGHNGDHPHGLSSFNHLRKTRPPSYREVQVPYNSKRSFGSPNSPSSSLPSYDDFPGHLGGVSSVHGNGGHGGSFGYSPAHLGFGNNFGNS